MTAPQLAAYLGGALGYALGTGAVLVLGVLLLRRVAGRVPGRDAPGHSGTRRDADALPALFLTLFFMFLAFSPFPDRATLDCSRGGMAPELTPFGFLRTYLRLWDLRAGPGAWLSNMTVTSSGMNFLICVAIGAALHGPAAAFPPKHPAKHPQKHPAKANTNDDLQGPAPRPGNGEAAQRPAMSGDGMPRRAAGGTGRGPVQSWRGAIGFAVLLSGTIELSQLTGMWGFYPCAYRRFDVDDLILNIAGIAAGFALARALRHRRPRL